MKSVFNQYMEPQDNGYGLLMVAILVGAFFLAYFLTQWDGGK